MLVFKFGGASVKDAASICNIPRILKHYDNEKIVIIISAMGKTTNALERVVNAYFHHNHDDLSRELELIKNYHFSIIAELFSDCKHPVYSAVQKYFNKVGKTISEPASADYDYEYDRIVSFGEMISSAILSHYLNYVGFTNKWFDITSILVTNNEFRNARVNWEKTMQKTEVLLKPEIIKNRIMVMQGFIGKSGNKKLVTLGREGSDYSASIIAYCTNAESVTIWKDVQGVLNADPKYFEEAHYIEKLSYYDAVELAYYGASVIHPKTIKPLENKKIPLYVKSFLEPSFKGTVIQDNSVKLPMPVYIFKVDQVLISIYPNDFSFIAEENLRDIFSILTEHRVSINLMQNTAVTFSLVIDNKAEKLEKLLTDLKKHFKVKYNTSLELITIRHFDQNTIDKVTEEKDILLEQKTRFTAQLVVKQKVMNCGHS